MDLSQSSGRFGCFYLKLYLESKQFPLSSVRLPQSSSLNLFPWYSPGWFCSRRSHTDVTSSMRSSLPAHPKQGASLPFTLWRITSVYFFHLTHDVIILRNFPFFFTCLLPVSPHKKTSSTWTKTSSVLSTRISPKPSTVPHTYEWLNDWKSEGKKNQQPTTNLKEMRLVAVYFPSNHRIPELEENLWFTFPLLEFRHNVKYITTD